jgi:trimeric autotransporter adhesin
MLPLTHKKIGVLVMRRNIGLIIKNNFLLLITVIVISSFSQNVSGQVQSIRKVINEEMINTEPEIREIASTDHPRVSISSHYNRDVYLTVPQTTKGLIQTGLDIKGRTLVDENGDIYLSDSTATVVEGSKFITGSIRYMIDDRNINKILVVFDGEPLVASALSKTNYEVNGKKLPEKSQLTYYEGNINPYVSKKGETNDVNGFVLITLPSDSIDKTGKYTFKVKDITNIKGRYMLPITKNIALMDNTKPTLKNVRVIGSKQIEVTFDEAIQVTDRLLARGNFKVLINGQHLEVADVSKFMDQRKLMLTLTQDFNMEDVNVVVETRKDQNGKIHISDVATPGNYMRETMVVFNSTTIWGIELLHAFLSY